MVRLLSRDGPALPAAVLFAPVERAAPAPRSDFAGLVAKSLQHWSLSNLASKPWF
jgi:hypothetical protein